MQGCSAIGATSGITVTLSGLPTAARTGHAVLCENTTCSARDLTPDLGLLQVDDQKINDAAQVTVQLVVTDPSTGKRLFDDSSKVTLRKIEPNGPGCGPTAWQAVLTIGSDGKLSQSS